MTPYAPARICWVAGCRHVVRHDHPCPALELAWALERDGFALARSGAGLSVHPRTMLAPSQIRAITQHRDALLDIVDYCAVRAGSQPILTGESESGRLEFKR